MPYFPTVEETKTAQQVTDVFRGYHHDLRIGDGEFYEMQNLTSDYYPMLASRNRRGVLDATLTAPGGMLARRRWPMWTTGSSTTTAMRSWACG